MLIDGEKRKLAKCTIGRLRRIEKLQEKDSIDALIEAAEICIDGDTSDINWDEVELAEIQEVMVNFLQQAGPISIEQLKRSIGSGMRPPAK